MDKLLIQRNLQKKVKEIVFKEINSTQLYCRENYSALLSKENMWHLIIAESQTNGIGQEDRKWESSSKNIYCTFVIPMKSSFLMFLSFIPLITVYSIAKVLKSYGIDPKVKWINDILVNNKKIAGILCESYTIGDDSVVLIGIGINTNMTQEELDNKDVDQEITSLTVEMEHAKNMQKMKNENVNLLNSNFTTNENSVSNTDEAKNYSIPAGNNYGMFSFNQNLNMPGTNNDSDLHNISTESDKDKLPNGSSNSEIKIAVENGIYIKTSGGDSEKIKIEIENKILIESLKHELYENINKILLLDNAKQEINYDDIKLNFTVFALNPLRNFIAYLNKNVIIYNTQFNNRAILGKFLGLDENGFAKIKEKNSNEIFAVTKGRLQPIRYILKDKWNDKENCKILEIEKIRFNNNLAFGYKHSLEMHHNCMLNKKANNIFNNPNSEEICYYLEGSLTDRLGNKLFVYGDLIEKKEILKDDENEIFKINLFFDLNKSQINCDITGYVDKDHQLEEFNLKMFYSCISLKGVFNPEKEIICFTYTCDNKDFDVSKFVKSYNNKVAQPDNEIYLNVNCTEKYERAIKLNMQ